MPVTKQRTLDYLEHEWGTYVERFYRLPEEERTKRVHQMGYASLRDLLAHILAWWQEGMTIVSAIAEGREYERKKYDFDVFNAEAVARFQPWDETRFMNHFEETRRKTAADLKSMAEAFFENRRVGAWLNGVVLLHAREHLISPSRFLLMDMLQNEWAEYGSSFELLKEERKQEFLSKQGYESFHDLLAHILGWWEAGMDAIKGTMDNPAFTWTEPDTDPFNRELVKKYSSWSDKVLFDHYDRVRLALIDLIANLPDNAFQNRDIESWLAQDVVEHYDEHALPQ
ncbi:MAG: ClbS/DfsB family four-helix bundle protein [Syntrophothermus sp.]